MSAVTQDPRPGIERGKSRAGDCSPIIRPLNPLYVRNRAIDLSSGAARAIGMMGAGTARVRMDVI